MEPPRGRGKAFSVLRRQFRFRITPAWAGKRFPYRLLSVPDRDHPRMGGEKFVKKSPYQPAAGSPPHGRGKGVVNGRAGLLVGITPAWAGKSRAHGASSCGEKDHPRMGGEKQRRLLSGPADGGSPPRRRGKVAESLDGSLCLRITPAWAGKRFWNRPWVWATSDHPRVGGEKPLYDPAHLGPQGSPPRRRGKELSFVGFQPHTGITPAWAGKSHHQWRRQYQF